MASYPTLAELAARAPAGVLQGLSNDVQQTALDGATAEANTYIRAQYTLPLAAPYDPVLIGKVCQLALWQLMNFKGRKVEAGKLDIFEQMHSDALAWLKLLSEGKVNLASNADATPGVRIGAPRVRSQPRRRYDRLR